MNKLNCSDIGNINHISEDIISLWQKIIHYDGQPTKIDPDMNYNQHKSNSLSYFNLLIGILKPIIDKIKISKEYLIKVEYSHLSKNL